MTTIIHCKECGGDVTVAQIHHSLHIAGKTIEHCSELLNRYEFAIRKSKSTIEKLEIEKANLHKEIDKLESHIIRGPRPK